MAILAECPICHRKQSTKNKLCSCGGELDKLKKQKEKVKYWITYRFLGGKQRKEFVGYSVEEARDAEGKRRGQRREGRIFDMLPEARMTFAELIEWYLSLKSTKKLASYLRIKTCLSNFGKIFGVWPVSVLRPVDLEEYQDQREEQGISPATIDMELSISKTMVTKAFDNDKVDGKALKPFRRIKHRLKKGSNARERILSFNEYLNLIQKAPAHLKALLVMAYSTGMRRGELMNLRWSNIDRDKWFIRLPADMTKEGKYKSIPINHHVKDILGALPRPLHHDFVFTYNGQPIVQNFSKSLRTACEAAGIVFGRDELEGFVFHDIRSTVKTNMLRAGVDKAMRDVIMGHSLKGMDAYYLKPTDEDLVEAMRRYTEWLDVQIANADASVAQNVAQGKKKS